MHEMGVFTSSKTSVGSGGLFMLISLRILAIVVIFTENVLTIAYIPVTLFIYIYIIFIILVLWVLHCMFSKFVHIFPDLIIVYYFSFSSGWFWWSLPASLFITFSSFFYLVLRASLYMQLICLFSHVYLPWTGLGLSSIFYLGFFFHCFNSFLEFYTCSLLNHYA